MEIEEKITYPIIRYLEWDSLFFKLKIGMVDIDFATKKVFEEIIKQKRDSEYELVYLFANNITESLNLWLYENGIIPIDIKITFHKTILNQIEESSSFVEEYVGITSEKLFQLAIESGHKSRFKKDERLNSRFQELYKTWIKKSVNGEMANVVLVSIDKGEITGFVTIRKKEKKGIIGLIAVDQHLKGHGIGRRLLMAAENWCSIEGCSELTIATQLDNSEACNFYLRNGYKKVSAQYIFHI